MKVINDSLNRTKYIHIGILRDMKIDTTLPSNSPRLLDTRDGRLIEINHQRSLVIQLDLTIVDAQRLEKDHPRRVPDESVAMRYVKVTVELSDLPYRIE